MKNQKGVILMVAFIVMSIILAISLGVSAIVSNRIKIGYSGSQGVSAQYIAEQGFDKVAYYDKTVGLCNICDVAVPGHCPDIANDPLSCNHCDRHDQPGKTCVYPIYPATTPVCSGCQITFDSTVNGQVNKVTIDVNQECPQVIAKSTGNEPHSGYFFTKDTTKEVSFSLGATFYNGVNYCTQVVE